jgi:hypothetical protein
MRTHHCNPTLRDRQVLDFCKRGYLMLEAVVPEEINAQARAYLAEHKSHEPALMREAWFVDGVVLNPHAASAVRSLLGRDYGLPLIVCNHRSVCPQPSQGWHRDGGSVYGPAVNYLQVFYYPEDCPPELGPTELLPGSHFLYSHAPWMAHYGAITGTVLSSAPAGSIFITQYNIWHRRSAATGTGIRNLLKYNYWRTTPPTRDWIREPDFDLETADYACDYPTFHREQFREVFDAAEQFAWLCGIHDKFKRVGGQGWPMNADSYKWYDVRERPAFPFKSQET